MNKITYSGTKLVPLSVHKLFWDQTIYKCPVPEGADPAKFRKSLGFVFLHIAERTGLTAKNDLGQVPMSWQWFNKTGNPARYAMHYHKTPQVQEWLEKTLIVTEHSRILGLSREWQFKPSFLRVFRRHFLSDEALYDITVPVRRRPRALSMEDRVNRCFVQKLVKQKFIKPDNLCRKDPQLRRLLDAAYKNQRPYRFHLDRMLDCLRNLAAKGKKSSYIKLWISIERICEHGIRRVGGTDKDRIVEFYDVYRVNEVGSRMFGTSQGLLRVVKRLCFDATYAVNYDMPQAQVTILKQLFNKYNIPYPEQIQLSHTDLAKTLGICRETAKSLNFGGIFKGWNNVPFVCVRDPETKHCSVYKTPLYQCLWNDAKVKAKLKRLEEGRDVRSVKHAQSNLVKGIWDKWKSLHKEISISVENLLTAMADSTRMTQGIYRFKNDMNCIQRVYAEQYTSRRYSVLSHYLQGTESRQLLEVLASNLWCSAEFDGALILGKYNQVVPMDVKPFCDDTDAVLLFDRVWQNGFTFKNDRRCIISKKISKDQLNTVNTAYEKYYGNH